MRLPIVARTFRRWRIHLTSQQRGCLENGTARGFFPVKVFNGRIQQSYYMVHPVA
jgi:hypothetical protein